MDAEGKLRFEPDVRDLLREVARVNLRLQDGGQASVWGVEGSGYGREISTVGVEEFLNKKLILVSDGIADSERRSGRGRRRGDPRGTTDH